jgi:UDP-glucose 4-epimerase
VSARTLVIGSSSPLGIAVSERLRSEGQPVALASRRGPIEFDVTDDAAPVRLLGSQRFDRIVYLANPADLSDPSTALGHLAGLSRVAEAAARSGTRRLVFASSAAVYGTSRVEPLTESSELLAPSDYARLKAASERALAALAEGAFSVVALRIFNVYGPGFDRSLINRLASADETPVLQVSSRFVRDYVHSDDVTASITAALEVALDGFAAVNVGSGRAVSNAELARLAPEGSFVPTPAGADTFSVADTTLATRLLGFTAQRRIEEMFPAQSHDER